MIVGALVSFLCGVNSIRAKMSCYSVNWFSYFQYTRLHASTTSASKAIYLFTRVGLFCHIWLLFLFNWLKHFVDVEHMNSISCRSFLFFHKKSITIALCIGFFQLCASKLHLNLNERVLVIQMNGKGYQVYFMRRYKSFQAWTTMASGMEWGKQTASCVNEMIRGRE